MINEILDDIFEEGWKDFVAKMRKENRRSNERLYRILEAIKGKRFVIDLGKLLQTVSEDAQIRISRKTSGMCFNDKRWKSFPELWIDQRSNERGTMTGTIYVQVKIKRWLVISYQT